jgi:hypothetical protein
MPVPYDDVIMSTRFGRTWSSRALLAITLVVATAPARATVEGVLGLLPNKTRYQVMDEMRAVLEQSGDPRLRERVGLPGFRFGRRYIAVAGTSPRYFTYYETETPDALASPVYLERGANPTPMTRHIMTAVFRNMSRTICRRTRSAGDGQAG